MDMNTKLAEISEVMADGYHWFHMREFVNQMEKEALESEWDDSSAQEILDIISEFHRLCIVIKRGPTC